MENITDGEIVKIDTKGRTRTQGARRAELLAEFERSGMSGAAFAKWAGIKYSTFANWRQKQRRECRAVVKETGVGNSPKPVHWVEAIVGEATTKTPRATGLVVDLSNGVRLAIGDGDQARLAGILLRELFNGAKTC